MRNQIVFVAGWLLSALFVILALRSVDFHALKTAFQSMNPAMPLLMILIYLSSFLVRAIRWRATLNERSASYSAILFAILIGYAANNVLPGRLGELVRASAAGRKLSIDASGALGSIFVERVLDGLILTLFLFLGTVGSSPPLWALSTARLGFAVFGGASLFVIILAVTRAHWQSRLESKSSSAIANLLHRFIEGVVLICRTPTLPVFIMGLTLVIWLLESAVFCIGMLAFGFKLPINASLFVLALVNLGILIPSSPGYLGTFQYFGLLALSAWSIDEASGLASIVVIHACQYLPVTLLGAWLLPYFGFSKFAQISKRV